ncbi:NAD(P)-dependent oxidoreductase [Streptomyces sp. JHA26]|uniref:NAD-dependent epimerase/dehydratase family protein n=1 Tax=Streptomyces sp. JHA26 TaxID=1917143 RepID=UPI000989D21F|nr:NAD(P)-dependent oxidoreductase [Streptomyces sp. JHA26]
MSPLRVVLTGATGFVGSAVLRELLAVRPPEGGVRVRALARGGASGRPTPPGLVWESADLTAPASLRGVCRDADVLIHLASLVSGDDATCAAVNVHGTGALMEEARRAGVGRIVHLSTAAVYGPGPHSGPGVGEIDPAPTSPASRTRLEGEAAAVEAGATVLRPGLVLGRGDRWVVPALVELRARVPARWDGGRALSSMVDVGDLARLIAALACAKGDGPAGVYHASHPVPVRNLDLMSRLTALGVLDPVTQDWTWQECLDRFRRTPGRLSERQFSLLARDHWYRGEEIWRLAGCPEGPGPLARLDGAGAWYRKRNGKLPKP